MINKLFYIILVLSVLGFRAVSHAQDFDGSVVKFQDLEIPSFSEYPVKPESFIKAKEVDLASHEKGRLFRTRLREGFKEPADFAGHYKIIEHGCGTSCQVNWIVDQETGKILGTISSGFGISYRLDSSLIIKGCDKEMEDDELAYCYTMQGGVHIYNVHDGKLVLLKEYSTKELFKE